MGRLEMSREQGGVWMQSRKVTTFGCLWPPAPACTICSQVLVTSRSSGACNPGKEAVAPVPGLLATEGSGGPPGQGLLILHRGLPRSGEFLSRAHLCYSATALGDRELRLIVAPLPGFRAF